jgi:hypothetical protein
MTSPSLPAAKIEAAVSTVLPRGAKGARNFLSAKIRRNPLKMLDSDERIQGNPSFSNAQNQGFRGQMA